MAFCVLSGDVQKTPAEFESGTHWLYRWSLWLSTHPFCLFAMIGCFLAAAAVSVPGGITDIRDQEDTMVTLREK